jgi:hypothetical protein
MRRNRATCSPSADSLLRAFDRTARGHQGRGRQGDFKNGVLTIEIPKSEQSSRKPSRLT